ncbi:MAG: dihydroneopterin aldolase [Puniceicoccales bacterium]|nr:dihydroneopterin aldolase [Puniceicoccales bacterium]
MDIIRINGVKCFGHHGATPEEKRLGQPFRVSLELFLDTQPAARTDSLALTVDYAAVIARVEAALREDPPSNLIETIAENIAGAVLRDFPLVNAVGVTLEKPFAPVAANFDGVSVSIHRARRAPAQ